MARLSDVTCAWAMGMEAYVVHDTRIIIYGGRRSTDWVCVVRRTVPLSVDREGLIIRFDSARRSAWNTVACDNDWMELWAGSATSISFAMDVPDRIIDESCCRAGPVSLTTGGRATRDEGSLVVVTSWKRIVLSGSRRICGLLEGPRTSGTT